MRLGFIGAGSITSSIVTGLVKSNLSFEEISLSPRNSAVATRLAELHHNIRVKTNNQAVVDDSEVVFLAVLPRIARDVVSPLAFRDGHRLINLVAGLKSEDLTSWSAARITVCRAIPLPFVADLCGVTAIYPHDTVATDIFSKLGRVVEPRAPGDFELFGSACSLTGTQYGILESVARWMRSKGMDYEVARAFLSPLFAGLGQAAVSSRKSFEDLRVEVSTTGGLNEKAFEVFQSQGGTRALAAALGVTYSKLTGTDP
jgi:pyrroline-5-carboxylate reductase